MTTTLRLQKTTLLTALGTLFLASGCEITQVDAPDAMVTVTDSFDPSKTVCDPFGGVGPRGEDQGLWANLYYLEAGQPQYTHVDEYLKYGTRADADIFFNVLNIPTRAFDLGFVTQTGATLKNSSGNTLYEWFALHFETEVRLSRLNRAAKYQFAVLSDDGALVQVNENGAGYQTILENDGFTPTRMRCSTRTISLDASSRLPMKVDYFQGPRYHIALVMLWREINGDEIADPSLLADEACDQSGNDLFFDSTQVPSAPTETWFGMMNRGWKVLTSDNYYLPASIRSNPCAPDPNGIGS